MAPRAHFPNWRWHLKWGATSCGYRNTRNRGQNDIQTKCLRVHLAASRHLARTHGRRPAASGPKQLTWSCVFHSYSLPPYSQNGTVPSFCAKYGGLNEYLYSKRRCTPTAPGLRLPVASELGFHARKHKMARNVGRIFAIICWQLVVGGRRWCKLMISITSRHR